MQRDAVNPMHPTASHRLVAVGLRATVLILPVLVLLLVVLIGPRGAGAA